jgi:light-regulated signal transduction histidine kinase (bacteriophytochrome)
MSATARLPPDRGTQSSGADYSRATLNMLGDLTEEKARLGDTQKAVLNILADFTDKKDHGELAQRAVLNILEDFDNEVMQRRRAEEEVRRANATLEQRVHDRTAELEAANRGLEEFSYSVSHDLRTPLRAIDGFSRILLEDHVDQLDAEGQRVLNVVRGSTVKMARLIDDILAFSRIGRLEMQSAPVDMEALVRGVLANELAPAGAGRGPTIAIGELPATHGDTAMLQRVWTNLLDNAIKYTAPKRNGRIEIGATAGGGETIFYVRDNGVGFDMQYVDKLFGVFQRLHGTEFLGTGIGLAIIKRIVTRHGGRVWAEGKVGEGASFYFTLPTPGNGP